MPIPVWYLKFKKEHGREPVPSELTESQRRRLRECCVKNLENARARRARAEVVARLEADPSVWHEVRRELEPLGLSDQFMKLLMEEGPEALLERVSAFVGQGGDEDHWKRVMREVVGVTEAEAPDGVGG